jgi:hypothetical protein
MRATGSTRIFRKKRLKSYSGLGEVCCRLHALHAQVGKMLARGERSGAGLAAKVVSDGRIRQWGETPTANAPRVRQRLCRDMRAVRAAGPLKRNYPSLFSRDGGLLPRHRDSEPGSATARMDHAGVQRGVIEHWGTTARAFHAARAVHAGICVRKTENRADYSAKILEEDGGVWNQV